MKFANLNLIWQKLPSGITMSKHGKFVHFKLVFLLGKPHFLNPIVMFTMLKNDFFRKPKLY